MKVKEKLTGIMAKIKAKNPNANWSNVITGLAILFLVAAFSYSYFSRSKNETLKLEDKQIMEEINKESGKETQEEEQKQKEQKEERSTEGSDQGSQEVAKEEEGEKAQPGEKGVAPVISGETTTVQKGEGLWHVAKRVCGDGEKYNVLAAANGLSVWDELREGMTLKVVCE